jgi:hypothetical protein
LKSLWPGGCRLGERKIMFKIITKIFLITLLVTLTFSTVNSVNAKPTPIGQSIREANQEKMDNLKDQVKDRVQDRIASVAAHIRSFRNGYIAVANAELTVIDGNTLTIVKEGMTYAVLVEDNSHLRRKFWGQSELSEWTIGDMISVVGIWDDETKTTIRARLIKNLSIQMRHGVFFGTVTSMGDGTFTMDSVRRGIQTVTVGENTKYTDRRGGSLNFSDILVGHRVRIRGLWNSRTSTITEVTEVKDFSLPEIVKPSGRPSISPDTSTE